MEVRKVHGDLDSVDRNLIYHLGYYEVEFQDGALRFQVMARICDNAMCLCDNLLLEWVTEQSSFKTWYDADRNFRDENQKELVADMEAVFRIVEKTETFQERISHLLFLRRKQVLDENKRNSEEGFNYLIPTPLLLHGHDAESGTLGSLRAKVKGKERFYPFSIKVCDDPQCFCYNMFLEVEADGQKVIMMTLDDSWSPVDDTPDNRRFTTRIKTRAMGSEKFRKLLQHMRTERRLENYHRYVKGYPEMMTARSAS